MNIVCLLSMQGDILLVADEFEDGWVRGLRLTDLEVGGEPSYYKNNRITALCVAVIVDTSCAWISRPLYCPVRVG